LGNFDDDVAIEESGFEYVTSVKLLGPTTDGIDGEDNDDFADRLASILQLMSPVAIVGSDLAKLAKTVVGIERAAVLDNYDLVNSLANQPGHATIAPIDSAGNNISSFAKIDLANLITVKNKRLLNGVIHVTDPTRTPVDITVAAIAYPGQDQLSMEAAGVGALEFLLDKANWGQPASGERRQFINKPVVSLYDVGSAVDNVEGIDRIETITIGLDGGAQTEADHTLPGLVPLPIVGDISVSVTVP
jgi:hypothetical protein